MFTVEAGTGKLTAVDHSPFDAGGTVAYLAAEPSGHFVYASQAGPAGIQAFAVDPAGALVKVTGSPFGTDSVHAGALVFHPNGRFLYGASGLVSGFSIDAGTRARSPRSRVSEVDGGGSDPMAIDLAIDPSGRSLYAVRSATGALDAYSIDPTLGRAHVGRRLSVRRRSFRVLRGRRPRRTVRVRRQRRRRRVLRLLDRPDQRPTDRRPRLALLPIGTAAGVRDRATLILLSCGYALCRP